ncbi:hypothetical protein ACRAWF_30275 [Streptomyces sp. L7]
MSQAHSTPGAVPLTRKGEGQSRRGRDRLRHRAQHNLHGPALGRMVVPHHQTEVVAGEFDAENLTGRRGRWRLA